MSFRRPEHRAPPELFYNDEEARKYTQNSRIMAIQEEMTDRAIELLLLPEDTPCLILDLGCGSGLSGEVLKERGHTWIGLDISPSMLRIAKEREVEGDILLSDLGEGIPFRAGTFDGAISISTLQWLCNADKSSHNPTKRLSKFFSSLKIALNSSARAVFQFYPENSEQIDLITTQAMKAGFFGGLVVDYPESTKRKKYFLVLMAGGNMPLPKALSQSDEQSNEARFTSKREQYKNMKGKPPKKSRDWILEKKERRRRQGRDVRQDSKFTGRPRSGRF